MSDASSDSSLFSSLSSSAESSRSERSSISSFSSDSSTSEAGVSSSSEGCRWEPAPGTDTVITTEGPIKGSGSNGTYAFLGIPFAEPPVGASRWQPPQPPQCRSQMLETVNYGMSCAQIRFEQGSDDGVYEGGEDCLYLNVFKPVHPEASALPVLFFIHGGGNVQGSASQISSGARIYDGSYLASGGDAIVVTTNYRLGPLGWLAHPALADENGSIGNFGLQDQIAALQWIRNNISAFGGDPERILVFGESGGAVDVCMLLVSAKAQGLFSRALIQSGGCVAQSIETRSTEAETFFDAMGCGGTQDVRACLMTLDAQTLVADNEHPLQSGIVTGGYGPVIDGDWIADEPEALLASGMFNRVPFIVGTNADEMAMAIAPGTVTPGTFELFVKAALPFAYWEEALQLYPPGDTSEAARDAKIHLTTDAQFVCPARRLAREIAVVAPVWRYSFEYAPDTVSGHFYGAIHGLELFYVFKTFQEALRPGEITQEDINVSDTMSGFWKAFAAFGTPNGVGTFIWPAYDAQGDSLLAITSEVGQIEGYRSEYCDFWDTVSASRSSPRSMNPNPPVERFAPSAY